MNYPESLQYLYRLINYEKTDFTYTDLKLDRMRELVERMGNPQKDFPLVLVAGSKGKGSTSYYLERILADSGFRTGLFVKPHLISFRERIRYNGELISPADLASLVSDVVPVVEAMGEGSPWGKPTYFEVSVALAFRYFQDKQVERAVVEVGLGGRLDATNVADPSLTVITPVSLDHADILGDTLPEIAREKAGILRSSVPCVLGRQVAEVDETLGRIASVGNVPLIRFTERCRFQITDRSFQGSRFIWRWSGGPEQETFLPLAGDHQVENFLTALLAANIWGVTPDFPAFQEELNQMYWPGRIQMLSEKPPVLFDVAHNQASFSYLLDTLKRYYGFNRAVFLLGFLTGKDFPGIGEEIKRFGGDVFLTTPFSPKAAYPEEIAPYFQGPTTRVQVVKEPYAARKQAIDLAECQDLPLVVAGSFYLSTLFNEALGKGIKREEMERC
ncbi:MAG TPA: folylpolyglutamate synthase/dihydrofolate synthase family protein [Atribacteraceae bacterium]|nr:folylpolyglutamate synthase/dihydrofolate synthase family protein [Atribacteraceae bacterium]